MKYIVLFNNTQVYMQPLASLRSGIKFSPLAPPPFEDNLAFYYRLVPNSEKQLNYCGSFFLLYSITEL